MTRLTTSSQNSQSQNFAGKEWQGQCIDVRLTIRLISVSIYRCYYVSKQHCAIVCQNNIVLLCVPILNIAQNSGKGANIRQNVLNKLFVPISRLNKLYVLILSTDIAKYCQYSVEMMEMMYLYICYDILENVLLWKRKKNVKRKKNCKTYKKPKETVCVCT